MNNLNLMTLEFPERETSLLGHYTIKTINVSGTTPCEKGEKITTDEHSEFADNFNTSKDNIKVYSEFVDGLSNYKPEDKLLACQWAYRMFNERWATWRSRSKSIASQILWGNGTWEVRSGMVERFRTVSSDEERVAMLKGIRDSVDKIDGSMSHVLMTYLMPSDNESSRILSNEIYNTLDKMTMVSTEEECVIIGFVAMVEESYSVLDKVRLYWDSDREKAKMILISGLGDMDDRDMSELVPYFASLSNKYKV